MSQTKIINKNPLQIKLYGINAGWLTISIDFGNEQIIEIFAMLWQKLAPICSKNRV